MLATAINNTNRGIMAFLLRRVMWDLRASLLSSAASIYYALSYSETDMKRFGQASKSHNIWADYFMLLGIAMDEIAVPEVSHHTSPKAYWLKVPFTTFASQLRKAAGIAAVYGIADYFICFLTRGRYNSAADVLLTPKFSACAAAAIGLTEKMPEFRTLTMSFGGDYEQRLWSSCGLLSFGTLGTVVSLVKTFPVLQRIPNWFWKWFGLPVLVQFPITIHAVDTARRVAAPQDLIVWQLTKRVTASVSALACSSFFSKSPGMIRSFLYIQIGSAAVEALFIWVATRRFVDYFPVIGRWGYWGRSVLAVSVVQAYEALYFGVALLVPLFTKLGMEGTS